MKLLHLGDLHLGKTLGDFDLIDDQRYILEQILELAGREGVDAVLIAGDVYDRAIPGEAAVSLLDSFLSALAKRHVRTFLISGNHDSDSRLNYGRELFEKNGIFISAVFEGQPDRHDFGESGDGKDVPGSQPGVSVFLLPFVKASQVKHFYPDEEIRTYEDAVRVILNHTQIDPARCNILVAHQFVAGRGEDPALGGSEGVGTHYVGNVEKIGYELFDAFDYVALGHIHSPQKVGREEVRYAGSILKYSLSEVNNAKSVPLITVHEGQTGIELVPLKPRRDVRHIRGKLKDLLDPAHVTDPEDFIYATLTDEEILNDAIGIFRQTYPNTVKIDYDNSHTRAVEQVDIAGIAQNRSFSELISDFYRMVYGSGISDEEMSVMRMAASEAGVLD